MNAQPKRIAIGGSAANPPHRAHRAIVKELIESGLFEKVIWIVSGTRKDKPTLTLAHHRVAMTEATFRDIQANARYASRFVLHTTGAFHKNKPTITLIEEYEKAFPAAEIVWCTGADVFAPRAAYGGKSEVEAMWFRGKELLQKNFLVILRPGYPHPSTLSLPDHYYLFEVNNLPRGSSSEIRERIRHGVPFTEFIVPEVADYINQYNLYR